MLVPNELVRVTGGNGQIASRPAILTELVDQPGGTARLPWEEFFFAEQHNSHTQRACESAVRRSLTWCEGGRV